MKISFWRILFGEIAPSTSETSHRDPKDTSPDSQQRHKEDIERWKRFIEAAHGEKEWMNYRLTWLLISQPLLFGALGWILKRDCKDCESQFVDSIDVNDPIRLFITLVCSVGFITSTAGLVGAAAAGRMHYQWTSVVNRLAQNLNEKEPTVPFGMSPHWPARSSSLMPSVIALTFVITWISIATSLWEYMFHAYWAIGIIWAIIIVTVSIVIWITKRP
jgi:hypothetical protein